MTKENYINVLLERRSLLLNLINERKEKEFKTEGIFSIRQLRGKIEIFRRIPTKPGNGEYLGKKKRDTAISLAEKDYNSKIIIAAEDEVKHIDEAIEILQGSLNPDSIFGTLPFIQQQLIEESTVAREYIRKWEFGE